MIIIIIVVIIIIEKKHFLFLVSQLSKVYFGPNYQLWWMEFYAWRIFFTIKNGCDSKDVNNLDLKHEMKIFILNSLHV